MLLYWLLLVNFSIFSMQISAFVLVCGRVLVEVFLFLMAFLFLIVAFSTAITAFHHSLYEFASVDKGMETLLEITLGMYNTENYKAMLHESTCALRSLKFDQRLEFNEGDIGVAGGIQVYEPSNLNPTTVDSVRRFVCLSWQDPLADDQSDDRLEKLEKLVVKAMKTITDKKGGSMPTGYSGASGMPQSSQSGASSGGSGDGSK
eukprot:g31111.t1